MKVIAMGGVVVRAQYHTEHVASAVADLMEKSRVLIILRPILEHADESTVRQPKSADIQCISRGMLAAPPVFAVVDVATGKAAEMVDPFHRLPVDSLSRRLQGRGARTRRTLPPGCNWRGNCCSAPHRRLAHARCWSTGRPRPGCRPDGLHVTRSCSGPGRITADHRADASVCSGSAGSGRPSRPTAPMGSIAGEWKPSRARRSARQRR